MPDLTPLMATLPPAIRPLLIGWAVGGILGWLLARDNRLEWAAQLPLWLLALATTALTPTGSWMPETGWLSLALARPPLWLPVGLVVTLAWKAAKPHHALRMGFAVAWLLTLGQAVTGESMTNAVEPIRLTPPLLMWLAYGVVGLAIDRVLAVALPGVLGALDLPEAKPTLPPDQVHRWLWGAAGLVAGLTAVEIMGRMGRGPTVTRSVAALVRGLGAAQLAGREFMHLTRPDEWLGSLAALMIGLGISTALTVLLKIVIETRSMRRILSSVGVLVLYAGWLSITLPASFIPQPGPVLAARVMSYLGPLLVWVIAMISVPMAGHLRGLFLIAWMLSNGWLPLLGSTTLGDRLYIVAAFRNGDGLAGVLLGHALIGTLFGVLLWAVWRRWLEPNLPGLQESSRSA